MNTPLLELRKLRVSIETRGAVVQAVRDVDLRIDAGETLALVGESGCGKSITALSVMGLLPNGARIKGGEVLLEGARIDNSDERAWNTLRGNRIGIVFQNPLSSFNPSMRIGEQIAESLCAHRGLDRAAALRRAVQLLERMRIAQAAQRARQYPFEFSGGMLQRAMIAMAVACEPRLLIADEPTTALDVTVQVEVLELLRELQRESAMGLLLITHDLGIVAQMADRVAVMYAGQIIEQAPVDALFHATAHPYTRGLKAALPTSAKLTVHNREPLRAIQGTPPNLAQPPAGCGFYARCESALRLCANGAVPEFLLSDVHRNRCWLSHPHVAVKEHSAEQNGLTQSSARQNSVMQSSDTKPDREITGAERPQP
jgi:oligopeptide/dipeptide ABC transporter ATP-binding protein